MRIKISTSDKITLKCLLYLKSVINVYIAPCKGSKYTTQILEIFCPERTCQTAAYKAVTSHEHDTSLSVNKMATYCLTVARLQVRDKISYLYVFC